MCIRELLIFAAATTVIASLPYQSEKAKSQFREFVKKYNKTYENEIEEAMRFGIFVKNLEFIDYLNKSSEITEFGITYFADRTHEEDVGLNQFLQPDLSSCQQLSHTDVEDFNLTDTHFDWRTEGVVSPVKNQLSCGSCWAFSAIGNLEGVYARKTGSLVELSAKQLVDCDTTSAGCSGGFASYALSYLKASGSILEADYPYIEYADTCKYNAAKVAVKISDCQVISARESAYAQILKQIGPLSIAVDGQLVKAYQNGIMHNDHCRGSTTTHAVLLVGFGEENGMKYWIVKNSWGEGFGEQGYFRMQRDVNCALVGVSPLVTAVV